MMTPSENFVVLMALIKYSQTLIDAEMAKPPESRNTSLVLAEIRKLKTNAESAVIVAESL